MSEQSEFGKGLCYCLGLFLAHAERINKYKESYERMAIENPELFTVNDAAEMWFNGAADHLFDFQDEFAPNDELKKRCLAFKDKCLDWRLSFGDKSKATIEDVHWALQEAKDILREIDTAHKVPSEKGSWE